MRYSSYGVLTVAPAHLLRRPPADPRSWRPGLDLHRGPRARPHVNGDGAARVRALGQRAAPIGGGRVRVEQHRKVLGARLKALRGLV